MIIYHIGTAVLGSIVITVASVPRAIIGFFNNRYSCYVSSGAKWRPSSDQLASCLNTVAEKCDNLS